MALIMIITLASCVTPSIQNEDIAHVDTPDGIEIKIIPDTEETIGLIDDMQTEYRLVIHYVYEDGTQAYEDYVEVIRVGNKYSVTSPHIDGYIASDKIVHGIMPKRNVEYTVFYFSRTIIMQMISLNDYETPLGLGASNMNVGICVE